MHTVLRRSSLVLVTLLLAAVSPVAAQPEPAGEAETAPTPAAETPPAPDAVAEPGELPAAAGEPGSPPDTAAAEALFQLGKALMDRGEVDRACEKFRASMRAEPAGGTMLNLALCHQLQGKLASAWAEYRKASELIRAAGQPERADEAMRLANDLEPKLSKLTVAVSKPVAGLQLRRDGRALALGAEGVAVPVDPAVYRIEASAPGHRSWSTEVTVGADADRQSVTIPPLEPLEGDVAAPAADEAGGSVYRLPYVTGVVMAAVGGTAMGVGAILGGLAASDVGDAESDPALCGPDKLCTPEGTALIDDARRKGTAATLLVGIGAATLVSGLVLVLTTGTVRSDEPAPAATAARLLPAVGPGEGGLLLSGTF